MKFLHEMFLIVGMG